jgi:hypothetical protein
VKRILSRSSRTDTIACTRCGSEDVYPDVGPFAALGEFVGRGRYACRSCRRPFWSRAWVAPPHSAEGPTLASPRRRRAASLAALDQPPHAATPGPPDLTALDAELARLQPPEPNEVPTAH